MTVSVDELLGHLLSLPDSTRLTLVEGVRPRHIAGNCWSVGSGLYVIGRRLDGCGEGELAGASVSIVLWACSEAAAGLVSRRIPGAIARIDPPPARICTGGSLMTQAQIRATVLDGRPIETASYRIAADGSFAHRKLQLPNRETAFFESRNSSDDELPIAYEWPLPGSKDESIVIAMPEVDRG